LDAPSLSLVLNWCISVLELKNAPIEANCSMVSPELVIFDLMGAFTEA
jgi:hypothetical protein